MSVTPIHHRWTIGVGSRSRAVAGATGLDHGPGRGTRRRADIGATVPGLAWLAVVRFSAGGLLLAAAVVLVAVPLARASK